MRWVRSILHKTASTHAAILLTTFTFLVGLIGVLLAVLMVTVLLARPSVEQIAMIINEGGQVGGARLLAMSGWSLIPIVVMSFAGLLFAGSIQRLAAARVLGAEANVGAALNVVTRRMPRIAGAAVVAAATVAALILVAVPLVAVFLLLAIFRSLLVRSARFAALPRRSSLLLLALPLAPAWLVAVRWSLALPVAAVEGRGTRSALAESWRRTQGAERTVGVAMTIAVVAAVAGSFGLMALGPLFNSELVGVALQVVGGAIFGTFPFVCAAVAHLGVGGEITGRLTSAAGDVAGVAIRPAAATLAMLLAVTSLTPSAQAWAATEDLSTQAEPVETTTRITSTETHWDYGGNVTMTIEVTSDEGVVTDGVVRVYEATEGLLFTVPVENGVATMADFAHVLHPGKYSVYAQYQGSPAFEPSQSAAWNFDVNKGFIILYTELVDVPQNPRIGDTVILRAWVSPRQKSRLTGDADLGEVVVFESRPDQSPQEVEIARADLSSGIVEIPILLRRDTLRLLINMDSRDFWSESFDPEEHEVEPGGSGGSTRIQNISPLQPPVELTMPPSIGLGKIGTLTTVVTTPEGIGSPGRVYYEYLSGGSWEPLGDVPTSTGVAALQVCAGSCPGVNDHPVVPFASTNSPAAQIRARYVPNVAILLTSEWATGQLGVHDGALDGGQCMRVDVKSVIDQVDPSLLKAPGIRVITSKNCVVSTNPTVHGWRAGTPLTLVAPAQAHLDFLGWEAGQTQVGTPSAFTWNVPAENPLSWGDINAVELTATYGLACYPVTANVQGSAALVREVQIGHVYGVDMYRDRCRPASGPLVVSYGAVVALAIEPTLNPVTGEGDVFIDAGSPSHPVTRMRAGAPNTWAYYAGGVDLTYQVRGPGGPTVTFGPQCRSVDVESTPDVALTIATAQNCRTAISRGFLRNSTVTVEADIINDEVGLSAWLVNGREVPELGTGSAVDVTVGAEPTTLISVAAEACHTIDVAAVAGPRAPTEAEAPHAVVRTAFTCPDGSRRFSHGTPVTFEAPSTVSSSAGEYLFGGWTDSTESSALAMDGSDPSKATWTVAAERSFTATAHYFQEARCSTVDFVMATIPFMGNEAFTYDNGGCGPGRYLDPSKPAVSEFIGDRATLSYTHLADKTKYPTTSLTVSPVGDWLIRTHSATNYLHNWTGGKLYERTAHSCAEDWGSCTIEARGDVVIGINACQIYEPVVHIKRRGDDTNRVFTPTELGLGDHQWLTNEFLDRCNGYDHLENMFPFGEELTLRTHSPGYGFRLFSWGQIEQFRGVEFFDTSVPPGITPTIYDLSHPMGQVIETVGPNRVAVPIYYEVVCHSVTLGDGMSIREPKQPNCPGVDPSEQQWIAGTFLEVHGEGTTHRGRLKSINGIIPGTMFKHETDFNVIGPMGRPAHPGFGAYALVDGDIVINGSWLSDHERRVNTLAQVGKFAVGVIALAGVAAIGVACPACGAALAVLMATTFLIDLIPGVDGMASNILSAVNPLSILECTASWGFDTRTADTGGGAPPAEMEGASAVLKTTVRSIKITTDASRMGADEAMKALTTRGSMAWAGAGTAFAAGLYENEVWNVDFDYKGEAALRNTSGWSSCMSEKYAVFS